MRDDSEQDLVDVARADEINLVSNLVVAAGDSPGRMSLDEIDRALGVDAPSADTADTADTEAASADVSRTSELPPAAV